MMQDLAAVLLPLPTARADNEFSSDNEGVGILFNAVSRNNIEFAEGDDVSIGDKEVPVDDNVSSDEEVDVDEDVSIDDKEAFSEDDEDVLANDEVSSNDEDVLCR